MEQSPSPSLNREDPDDAGSTSGRPKVGEQNVRELVEWIDAAIWEYDTSREVFSYISRRIENLLGYPVERWLTESGFWFQTIHPEDRDFAVNFCSEATARGEDHVFEYRAIAADGRIVWLRDIVRVIPPTEASSVRLAGLFVDVTELKREEWAARDREVRNGLFQMALLELAKNGAVARGDLDEALRQIADVGARTLDVNLCGIWEYHEESLLLTCLNLYDRTMGRHTSGAELDLSRAPRYLHALSEGRIIAASDVRTDPRTSEFNEVYLIPMGVQSMMDVPIRLGGKVVGIICFEHSGPQREWSIEEQTFASSVADLAAMTLERAQRKRLEDQLRQSQRIEALGRLASGIAHDFNNLLTVILGHCQLIEHRVGSDSPIYRDVANIEHTAERAAALTKQLLSFSRRQLLEPRIIEVPEVLRALDEMLHRLLGDNIALSVETESHLGAIYADPGQIEQVVLNLAINARDAMPDGGRLTIRATNTELSEDDALQMPNGHAGSFVVLNVEDTGVGMDTETLARIFEPFFTTKEPGKGTGLGLSTVHSIVEQSGGFIRVHSFPGDGTSFQIYLPRVESPMPRVEREAITINATSRNEMVLLVEDEDLVREVIEDLLKQADYRVLTAANGAAALRILEKSADRIDLVLTDLMMPGVGGFELARRINAMYPKIKILIMSAYPTDSVQPGSDEKSFPLIQKPFAIEALAAAVRSLLDNASA